VKAWVIAWLVAVSGVCAAQTTPMPVCGRQDGSTTCATAPKLTHHVEAEYSDYGRKKKINGVVVMKFTVLPDGTTAEIVVIRSLEKSLDEQAIRAVRQWRFDPGTYQGQPVAVTISAEATFRIY
jgi:periplasmic protein TonB